MKDIIKKIAFAVLLCASVFLSPALSLLMGIIMALTFGVLLGKLMKVNSKSDHQD